MEVKSEGTAVGVAYWFTLHLYRDITIATYQPMEVSITHTHTYTHNRNIQDIQIHVYYQIQTCTLTLL